MIKLPEIIEPKTAYIANIRALWHHIPHLAQKIEFVDECEELPTQSTRSKDLTCQVPGPKGDPIYLHSRYDPPREAAKWTEGVLQQAQELRDKQNEQVPMCYIIDGFGLGYHVKALYEKLYGDAFIIVCEPNIALIRTAITNIDYSELIASDRLVFITIADRGEIFRKLQNFGVTMMMGVIFTQPLQQLNFEFNSKAHKLISEYAAYQRTTLVTLIGNSINTCKNILYNLPTYIMTPPINILEGRFNQLPAVVVSAGPSLRRNVKLLKKIRDKVVVIAVQTTLKPLLAEGIRPDFVTSLDYHEISKQFFEGLEDLSDIHLIAEPKANWNVIDYYRTRGPISLLGSELYQVALQDMADDHDMLPAGTTVAHLAFYLAQYIGADPIIFIGQDLAFTDHVYYSPGMAIHQTWRPELNRFCTVEMKEWERIVRNRGTLRKVLDIHGKPIYTDEQMFTYIQQFEKDFAQCPAEVIDATEGGAQKQFCTTMSLKEAAQKYCKEPIDKGLFAYRDEIKIKRDKLKPAQEAVLRRIKDLEEFAAIGEETLGIVREMIDLVDDQAELNRRMVRLDELRTRVKHRMDTHRLASFVGQSAELHRFRQDRTIGVEHHEGKELQRHQLRRDIGYVAEVNKGCERMIGMLRECVDRIEEALRENDESRCKTGTKKLRNQNAESIKKFE